MKLCLSCDGKNSTLELHDGQYVVGRDEGADVRVDQMDVSNRHALLRVDGERLFVSDLGSLNGTTIDGADIARDRSGTEVLPGSIVSLASLSIVRPAGEGTWRSDTSHDLVASHTYFDDTHGLVGVSSRNISEMLSSLFELISMDGRAEGFEDYACEFISRWIDCERVVLLLDYGPGSELDSHGSWSAGEADDDEIALSTTIINEVFDKRASLLLADPSQLSTGSSDSICAARLTSAMAVPLFDNERVRGILYVDTRKPGVQFDEKDLEILSATANAVAVKLRERDLEKDLTVARQIQRRMLPGRRPMIPDYEVAARLESCFAIGGDFYLVGEPIAGKALIVLGDVAGKGLPAALAMAACAVLIPALDAFCDCPCTLVEQLHRSLVPKLSQGQFVTLFLGQLDLATGRLQYVNAGHDPPMIVRTGAKVETLESTGGPIGLFPEFMCTGEVVQLGPGDLLVVFSDGVTEATIRGDEFFGRARATAVVLEHQDKDLKQVMDVLFGEIKTFLKGGHASDDTTLLMLRRCREWMEPS